MKSSDKSIKSPNTSAIIMKRELSSYFSSPIAYIVICMNIIILSLTFFKGLFLGYNFFLYRSADLRILFLFQSILLTVFIPIITMRLFSEEKRTGSIETLMTLPVTETNVVLGKTLAAFVTSLAVVLPTILIPILVSFCGKLDLNQIISGYLGLILLCALFSTIGVFASSVTKHQIVSLFVSLPICAVLMACLFQFRKVFRISSMNSLSSFQLMNILLRLRTESSTLAICGTLLCLQYFSSALQLEIKEANEIRRLEKI